MRSFILLPLLTILVACAAPDLTQLNTDASFSPPPELLSSFQLRERHGLQTRFGATAIYVDSEATHHIRSEASTVAWKDETGKWMRTQAIEDGPGGLLQIERTLVSNETSALTVAQGRTLDRLISEPGLYSGKSHRTGKAGIGGTFHEMTLVTPYGRSTIRWDGKLRGKLGAVADIVLGQE